MRRTLSISLRLGLLFAAIALAVAAAVDAYLYVTLSNQMGQRDDTELLNKAAVLRQVMGALPAGRLERDPIPPMLRRVMAQDGVVVQARPDHAGPPVPLAREPRAADIVTLDDGEGARRVLSILAGSDARPVDVMLVRLRSDRLAILRRYVLDLLGALAAGTLVATALGFAAVRHGLRPLYGVAARANDISVHRLATRMPLDRVPHELHALVIAFNAMLDRLEESVQRLSGFAADLAHDLRTPVNALMMQTQVALSRARSNDDYQGLLASNLEEYERLSRMIENTLFLARADSAHLALRRDAIDVAAELEHVRDYFDMVAEDRDVRLVLDAATTVRLWADPVLLRRALNNLVSNAMTHTPPGGTVQLRAARDGAWTILQVADSGPGIAPEHVRHVFERYYRADQARSGGSSAGLGLAIVRAIMLLHGGGAEVESEPGRLTTFTLRFPPPPA